MTPDHPPGLTAAENDRRQELVELDMTFGLSEDEAAELKAYRDRMNAVLSPHFDELAAHLVRLTGMNRTTRGHPLTCGGDRGDEVHRRYAREHGDRDEGLLVATPEGWRWPACGWTQVFSGSPGFLERFIGDKP